MGSIPIGGLMKWNDPIPLAILILFLFGLLIPLSKGNDPDKKQFVGCKWWQEKEIFFEDEENLVLIRFPGGDYNIERCFQNVSTVISCRAFSQGFGPSLLTMKNGTNYSVVGGLTSFFQTNCKVKKEQSITLDRNEEWSTEYYDFLSGSIKHGMWKEGTFYSQEQKKV